MPEDAPVGEPPEIRVCYRAPDGSWQPVDRVPTGSHLVAFIRSTAEGLPDFEVQLRRGNELIQTIGRFAQDTGTHAIADLPTLVPGEYALGIKRAGSKQEYEPVEWSFRVSPTS